MKFSYSKGLLVFLFWLLPCVVYSQPGQYDFISSNSSDTIWLSRTNALGHISDYYVYGWWYFKNYKCDRENHSFSLNIENDGVHTYSGGTPSRAVLSSSKRLGIGPVIDHRLKFWMWEHDWSDWSLKTDCYNNRLTKTYDTTLYQTILPPINVEVVNEGAVQHFITFRWEKGTDIPDNQHQYQVYKDGKILETINGNLREYTDYTLPGTYLYELRTYWSGKDTILVSVTDSVTASTFLLDFSFTPKPGKIDFSWNPLVEITNIKDPSSVTIDGYKITRIDTADQSSLKTIMGKSDLTADRGDGFDNSMEIPGYKYQYILEPYPLGDYYSDTVFANSLPDGGLAGKVESSSGLGVPGVEVCAIRMDTVPQDTTSRYCTLTDQQGNFHIDQIYYYDESEFTLQPRYKDHGFKLSELSFYKENEFLLERGNNALGGITFVDTTSLVVQGQILQKGFSDSCSFGIENVLVKIYSDTLVDSTYTDASGIYSFCIDGGGDYSFVSELFKHSFTPDSFALSIYTDTVLTPVYDNTMHKLSGFVRGACQTYFGQAKIRIYEGNTDAESCIDTSIITNESGYYEILLPANTYTVSVEDFISEDITIEDEEVIGYFTSRGLDLKEDSIYCDFVYRNKPQIEISGFTNMGCGDYEFSPILKQDFSYPLQIRVFDVFGENTCPADTGYILVQDRTGYEDIDTTVALENGEAVYFIKPGFPNVIADYTRNISFNAVIEKENILESKDVFIEGAQLLENTFVTTSPEIPLFILHDPPGDNSYAYLQEESSSRVAIGNILHETKNVDGFSNEWKVCPRITFDIEGGFGFIPSFEFEVEAGWRRKRTVNEDQVNKSSSETIFEMDHKKGYQTSSDPELTSVSGGDLYIGGALNLIYSETREISYNFNTCQVETGYDIYMFPHSLATDFVYSENHIRNYLVPEFERLQHYYEELGQDTASFFEDQKNIWLSALANNQKNLSDSSTFIKRISFDGGAGPISEETTNRSTIRNSYEFHSVFDTTVMRYWKVDVAGIGYERSKVKSKVKIETGTDSSYSETEGTTTGFVLKDDDIGDQFMVNVYNDNVYGTPAFKLVSGNSSCPYEKGTRPREGVQLTANKYVAMVDDPNGTAVFRLQLSNTSQSSENRDYNLFFHQGSNPDGARLTLGGSQIQAGIPIPYTLPSWGSSEATVTVERGPEAFDYDNLMFTLESGCVDQQIIDTLQLDVHFKSTCSDLFMSKPADNWIISGEDEGLLKVTLGGYERELLNDITIQICQENDYDNWLSMEYLTPDNLQPDQTDVHLILDEIPDGSYELRARLECNSGKSYTTPFKGIVDTEGPSYFGVPEPSDNILDAGDIISVLFDENINSQAFSSANVTFMNETSNEELVCDVGCSANLITIFPDFPEEINSADTFRVFVFGLKDLHNNEMSDTVTWMFTVRTLPEISENEDTDNDTILNVNDNCPYTANSGQGDIDNDGIGDACDIDMDGDGFENTEDNCPYNYNMDQSDLDEDNIGDICDDDDDGDMVPDSTDNKPIVFNPDQSVGLEKYKDKQYSMSIYPNPAKSILYVELGDWPVEKVELINTLGEILDNSSNINKPVYNIDLSKLQPGVYLIRALDFDGQYVIQKFIKE